MKSHSISRLNSPPRLHLQLLIFLLSIVVALTANGPAVAIKASATCDLKAGPYRTVVRVLDGDTLELDDGKIVRLIGALAAHASDAGAAEDQWPLASQAKRTLSSLALGKSVRLGTRQRIADRNGKVWAQVFAGPRPNPVWLQGEMLRRGLARAYGLPDAFDCMAELKAHEQVARDTKSGLWQLQRIYGTKRAGRGGWLLKFRNRFERVRGRVLHVADRKSATYLNFGDDWRRDFTIRVSKNVRNANPDWAANLNRYKDRDVVVRGWIERRNGPLIDLWHPSQIDLIDQPVINNSSASELEAAVADERKGKPAASDKKLPVETRNSETDDRLN